MLDRLPLYSHIITLSQSHLLSACNICLLCFELETLVKNDTHTHQHHANPERGCIESILSPVVSAV